MAPEREHVSTAAWLYWVAALLYFAVCALLVWTAPADLRIPTVVVALLVTAVFVHFRPASHLWLYSWLGLNVFAWKGGPIIEFPGMKALALPKAHRQRQFPEEPQNVYKGDEKDALPPRDDGLGYKMRAFRVMSGPPEGEDRYAGHLNQQMAVVMTGTVRYHVNPEHPFDFQQFVPGDSEEEKFGEAERQMYDTWGNVIKGICEVHSPSWIVQHGSAISRSIFVALAAELLKIGLVLDEVNMESPDFGHDLTKELQKPSGASAAGAAVRTMADAEGYKLKVEGEGAAAADLAKGKALADAVEYQAGKLTNEGARFVFAADKAAQIVGPGDKIVMGPGSILDAFDRFAAKLVEKT